VRGIVHRIVLNRQNVLRHNMAPEHPPPHGLSGKPSARRSVLYRTESVNRYLTLALLPDRRLCLSRTDEPTIRGSKRLNHALRARMTINPHSV
jgi:hypothetical protein